MPTYFHARGERHHKISKGCDTQEGCLRRQGVLDTAVCSRTAYDDWACAECCTGDLCNYYVTASTIAINLTNQYVTTVNVGLFIRWNLDYFQD